MTGVRLHPPGRTDKNLCRCFGAPARRVFPDHLITYFCRSFGAPARRVSPDHLITYFCFDKDRTLLVRSAQRRALEYAYFCFRSPSPVRAFSNQPLLHNRKPTEPVSEGRFSPRTRRFRELCARLPVTRWRCRRHSLGANRFVAAEVPFLRGQVTMLDYTGENTRRTWLNKLIQ